MTLSVEQWQLVLNNKRLVHYYIHHKIGTSSIATDYEELESIGMDGLIKAAATYSKEKNITFATYAMTCIRNEIGQYFRKENKRKMDISLDEPIADRKDEGNPITIGDIIEDSSTSFQERIMVKDQLAKILRIILNCLNARDRYVILNAMGEVNQHEIAKKLKLQQSSVSRNTIKIKATIRKIYEEETNYSEKILVKLPIEKEELILSFRTTDISYTNFKKILEKAMAQVDEIPEIKLEKNESTITLRLPIIKETMTFIAEMSFELP